MITIKAPERYRAHPGALAELGEEVARYGRHVLVITGANASWHAVADELARSLEAWHVAFTRAALAGYPSVAEVRALDARAADEGADVIVGVGGGRALDAAKAVANECGLPIVTVPTVAATCAAWAARSILYTPEGTFDRIRWNRRGPVAVVADTDVLLAAPRRYLASGILDTLAKWYEFAPLLADDVTSVSADYTVAISKAAFDLLQAHGRTVYGGGGTAAERQAVVDAVLFLAGTSGSAAGGAALRGFAHPVYFASTFYPAARRFLHGEKVAFGLAAQFVLQGRDDLLAHHLDDLAAYRAAYALDDWGVASEATAQVAAELAHRVYTGWPQVPAMPFVASEEAVASAVRRADAAIRAHRAPGDREEIDHG